MSRFESSCEICGKSFKELKEEDPKNEQSWTLTTFDRSVCMKCAKPLIPILRMERGKSHHPDCTCHDCQIGMELGYFKKNGEWVKRPTMICKSAKDGCETCYHSKEHILHSRGYCNHPCNQNRIVGCEEYKIMEII